MMRIDPVPPDAGALAETKAYLRLDSGQEDALLARLLAAAVAHGEALTGQLFVRRGVVEMVVACTGWTRLAATPVAAISALSAATGAGVPAALPVEGYAIDIDANGDGWVRLAGPGPVTRATVAYTAGLAGDWSTLPEPLRQGAVRLAAHLFSHRDAADEGAPPAAVAALWRPWRRMRLS